MSASHNARLASAPFTASLIAAFGFVCLPPPAHAQFAPAVVNITSSDTTGANRNIFVPPNALPGTVVLMAAGSAQNPADRQNRSNWLDVVEFDGQGKAAVVSNRDGNDPAATFAHVPISASTQFIKASAMDAFTRYDPHCLGSFPGCIPKSGPHANVVYNIYSQRLDDAPEPTTPATLCLGLLGVGVLVLNAWRTGQRRTD